MDDITGGDIYIGAAETDAFRHVAQAAMALQSQYPDMRYHLFSGNVYGVIQRLDRGLDDFGIVVDPVDLSKYNYVTLPYRDRWGVIMQKNNPLASKAAIRAEDLIGIPLIVSRQAMEPSLSRNEFSAWFGDTLDQLKIVATYSLGFNAFIMAREGLGSVIGFDKMINTATENKLEFRPLEPQLESGLHIIWKKYQVFSPAAELFLNEIKQKMHS